MVLISLCWIKHRLIVYSYEEKLEGAVRKDFAVIWWLQLLEGTKNKSSWKIAYKNWEEYSSGEAASFGHDEGGMWQYELSFWKIQDLYHGRWKSRWAEKEGNAEVQSRRKPYQTKSGRRLKWFLFSEKDSSDINDKIAGRDFGLMGREKWRNSYSENIQWMADP